MDIPSALIPLLAYRESLIEQLEKEGYDAQTLTHIAIAGARITELLQAAYKKRHQKG